MTTLTPERGYSAARFVPGTGDRVLLAVKSIELAAAHMQTSFLSVITIDGQELLPETEVPGNIKCVATFFTAAMECEGCFHSDVPRWCRHGACVYLLCWRARCGYVLLLCRFEGLEFI